MVDPCNPKHMKRLVQKEKRFFEALKEDDERTVVAILACDSFKLYMKDRDKLTLAFMQVVLLNNVNLLRVLVQNGLDICVTDSMFEENGVMHAARYGHTGMIGYLLDNGVPVNHQAENGATALHVSVENKQYEALQQLVKHPAVDVNIQDRNGFTPLAWATRLRDAQSIRMLLDAGCNCETRTFFRGITPIHISVDTQQALWKAKYAPPDVVRRCIHLLVDAGADINKGDLNGNSALVYAIETNNIPGIKYLLQLSCDLNCKGTAKTEMQTESSSPVLPALVPLYLAIKKYQLRTVQILCKGGVPYHKLSGDAELWTRLRSQCPLLYDWLFTQVHSVKTLREQCRNVVRDCVGGKLPYVLPDLDIPTSLQKFVCLSEIDDI